MATTAEPANTMQSTDNEEDARSAKDRTFGITEIHEAILIKLDMKTLLFAQRVNRDWQKLIDASPSLQKKLFMQPATAAEAIELGITHGDRNAFLEDDSFAALNSLLIDPEDDVWDTPTAYILDFSGNASWKRMLLSQPPVPERNIDCWLDPLWRFYHSHQTPRFTTRDVRPKSLAHDVIASYQPVEEEWKEKVEVKFLVRDVSRLICHDCLMEMKDSPPKRILVRPGSDIRLLEEE